MSNRRIDLSKFKGNSDSEDEGGPPVAKPGITLNPLKQQMFSRGIQKKTKKDLEREAEERKRVEEEKATAEAFKEFQEAFEGDAVDSSSGGGRGGRGPPRGPRSMMAGRTGFVKASGGDGQTQAYQPTRSMPIASTSRSTTSAFRSPSPEPSKPKPKGKRAMDSFLEQIKRDQANRVEKFGKAAALEGSSVSAMAAWEKERGSRDTGDPETTNLYISNLPSGVTESTLGMFFAKIGPIATVKVMWPRGDEDASVGGAMTGGRRVRPGLSGFVAFMRRKDAEVAVKDLDGFDWGGCVLRVGWGKSVRLPLRPIYEISAGRGEKDERRRSPSPARHDRRARSRSRSRSRTRSESRDRYRSQKRSRTRSQSRSRGNEKRASRSRDRENNRSRGRSRSYTGSDSFSSASSRSRSPPPAKRSRHDVVFEKLLARVEPEKQKFVKAVADKVRDNGHGFEEMLREREAGNGKFAFLRNVELPEYHLYRSYTDFRYRLPTPPPDAFADDGRAEIYSTDSAEDSERERTRKGQLGKFARRRFESLLRAMTGKRAEIARCMEFAMIHASAADEVAEIICQSLMIEATAVPRKIARLHLVSDILHNASSPLPNVWRYRQAFENLLPKVFEHLADVHRSLVAYSGRIGAEAFRAQCSFVVDIWENWIAFPPQATELMKAILNGASAGGKDRKQQNTPAQVEDVSRQDSTTLPADKFKKGGGFKASFKPLAAAAPVSAEPVEDLDGETMDLDGEEMDLDGAAMDDIDGQAMEDV